VRRMRALEPRRRLLSRGTAAHREKRRRGEAAGLKHRPDLIRSAPLDLYFDYMGVRLDADKAAGRRIVLNWRFTDTKQDYVLNLENCALTCTPDALADHADATLALTRSALNEISRATMNPRSHARSAPPRTSIPRGGRPSRRRPQRVTRPRSRSARETLAPPR
jgi:alkyl sulfatase BDS1-like metallo-beta-lactamase superfamily hydrolase